jgi:uncharacterized protein (DUF362 family)/ferredoxin
MIALASLPAYGAAGKQAGLMAQILQRIGFTPVPKVVIKPNWVNDMPAASGVTTDPVLVGDLAQALLELGVGQVVVAEGPMDRHEQVFARPEVSALAGAGLEVVDLTRAARQKQRLSGGLVFDSLLMPQVLQGAGALISFAKLKTHALTGATLSVKNLFGVLHRSERRYAHVKGIDGAIADVYHHLESKLTLYAMVDAVVGLQGRLGPCAGDPVNLGLLAASDDPVALDRLLSHWMGLTPERVGHLELLRPPSGKESSKPKVWGGEFLEPRRFDLPPHEAQEPERVRGWADRVFKKTAYLARPRDCVSCGRCSEVCPQEIIDFTGNQPSLRGEGCIGCLCCVEVCREGALDYQVRYQGVYGTLKSVQRKLQTVGHD